MNYNALLAQLGYNTDEANIAHIKRILNNSDGVEPTDVITLNDHLKSHLCFVALSSSEDRLKIKNVATIPEIKQQVEQIIQNWSIKNKILLKKINETTYYIIGKHYEKF
ncbi:hypothetical protein LMG7974_01843 [Campylobacter majalis]|uniref:Type II secretion system protein n=1 Tax=Campylobacter majalis TaxID=2790656 RepID=A0ABN7KB99_9BACT|nr:type II secretion system protein [Campylobacter majalis]CAD7289760.1 hypothetical protein LMG7974_01843 [Campylobacter majalis]